MVSFDFVKSGILSLFINLIIPLVSFWRKPEERGVITASHPSRSFLLE
jgi:hypothetical protein